MLDGKISGRKVLIVDDEATIARTLSIIFKNRGFDARAAYSAEEALQVMQSWEPEIAIIDVCLPAMNGIDLAILLMSTHPKCKLVLFSGQPRSAELSDQAAKEGHLFEILAKPVHPDILLERAAQLLSPMQTDA